MPVSPRQQQLGFRRNKPSSAISQACAGMERLEARQLLSAAKATVGNGSSVIKPVTGGRIVYPVSDISNATNPSPGTAYTNYVQYIPNSDVAQPQAGPVGNNPATIRARYGIGSFTFNGTVADGSGTTIAIVDAYDDAGFVNSGTAGYASSNLGQFDATFGITPPASFSLTKVNQTGGTTYPSSGASNGWNGEEALDVEWAHAMAPGAKILFVEANSSSFADLNTAVNYAKAQPGVVAVSMSYGLAESQYSAAGVNPVSSDSVYTSTSQNVTFIASSGDSGGVPIYQSTSPNVLGIGGTYLGSAPQSTTGTERGWTGSGGGVSVFESKPSYQNLVSTPNANFRTAPDVSADADPNSGVAIYDSPTYGGFFQGYEGGTSLAAPLWAGFIAIVNQGRQLKGLGSLAGYATNSGNLTTQGTIPKIYQLAATDFNDQVSGNAGNNNAAVGYDAVTGRGSPKAVLYQDLASGVTVSGTAFSDFNGNGTADAGETRYGGQTVYLDYNNNGVLDNYEPSTTTAADGTYSFADQVGGRTFVVRYGGATPSGSISLSGNAFTTAAGSYTNSTLANANLRFFPTTFSGTAFTVRNDGSNNEQIFTAATATGTPAYSVQESLVSTQSFTGTGSVNTFNIDLSNGSPIPASGISYTGNGSNDTVIITGSTGGDTVTASGSTITILGSPAVTFSSVESLAVNLGAGNDSFTFDSPSIATTSYDPGTGSDTLTVKSGTLTLATDLGAGGSSVTVTVSGGTLVFNSSETLASLTIAGGTSVSVGTNGNRLLVANTLLLNGTAILDLNDNDALVHSTAFSTLSSSIATARDNGLWDGNGITSSAAKPTGGTTKPTGLGILTGTEFLSISAANSLFDGKTVVAGDSLIKYTYNGDADFNGVVNANDYGYIDSGYQNQNASGFVFDWFHGNFNFDSKIDANDYALIDSAYQLQTGTL